MVQFCFSTMVRAGIVMAAGAVMAAEAAESQQREPDPHKVDVAQMVACKYDVPTFNDYAMALGASGEGAAALGLTRIEDTPNPFMHEYQLAAPIDVLGWRTQRVALASGALLAVLDQVKPQDVAQRLGIEEALRDDDFKYMAMRVAHHTQEKVGSNTLNTVISHEVSTVITHPGQVLVGCSYRVNTY